MVTKVNTIYSVLGSKTCSTNIDATIITLPRRLVVDRLIVQCSKQSISKSNVPRSVLGAPIKHDFVSLIATYEHKYRSPHDVRWFSDGRPSGAAPVFGKLVLNRGFTRFGRRVYWLSRLALDFQLLFWIILFGKVYDLHRRCCAHTDLSTCFFAMNVLLKL